MILVLIIAAVAQYVFGLHVSTDALLVALAIAAVADAIRYATSKAIEVQQAVGERP